ncbi:unnamed protein product [Rotaria socialis]|uniref:BED-type domain-containing protein n=1 Tax=Rotaria socialis TaxID=392032 RepID=A0A818FL33_9BILA|nr:unnamed protein product [Rotaria socialis]CAF4929159.1 unnamed protein product [Rotaria socialis]
MKDQELPSESTSRPIFRQNLNKTTSSANMHTRNSSSSKDLNKIKRTYIQSTPKSKIPTTTFDNYISTDDDMIGDHGSTPVQKSRSNNSSTCQININVEENLIHLDDPLASDETDNNEPNPPSNVVPKTTTKTKQDVWEYFTKQYNGEVKCNLCPNSSKVIHLFLLLDLRLGVGH